MIIKTKTFQEAANKILVAVGLANGGSYES